MLSWIQGLRAAAVIAVVLFHAASIASDLPNFDNPLRPILNFGFAGVDLFFVISGFIMVHINRDRLGDSSFRVSFVYRRISRIFPSYFIAFVIAFIIYTYYYSLRLPCYGEDYLIQILNSLFLLPFGQAHCLIPQAWTLNHEFGFYLAFAGVFFLPSRFVRWCLVGWGITACLLTFVPSGVPPLLQKVSSIQLQFLLGCFVAFIPRPTLSRMAPAALAIGILGFAFSAWLVSSHAISPGRFDQRFLTFGVASAFLVAGAVGIERLVKLPAAIVLLGDASYAIYLVHLAAVLPLREGMHVEALSNGGKLLWVGALVLVGLLAGLAFHLLLERPLQQLRTAVWPSRRSNSPVH